ncbi:MAG TPA: protein TolA [Xanthobacteraceae bacterium]|nr:protein TolA [Xanthobacteraceae bacterium]
MTISLVGHGVVLVWALVSFARPLETKPLDTMPVDIISAEEFSKMTAGADKAPPQPQPKPLVEKIAEPKPVEDLNAKVVEKKEVTATTSENTPEPKPKQPDPKPAAAPPEPKTETKAADKKEPEQKIDPIAEALKKDEAKKPEKKAEAKPQPVKKPEPQPPKFDPRKVAALLDKRDPQRLAAAGSELNALASLGTPKGAAKQLSMSELDALRARLRSRWTPPPGAPPEMNIRIFISLRRDGTLAAPPQVQTSGSGGIYQTLKESTIRAIYASQPFDMLRPENYELWRDLDATFSPKDFM